MALPATPQSYNVQQGNSQVWVSWSIASGATSYTVQRSTDGVTYSTVSSSTNPNYLDTDVTVGSQYWYRVKANNSEGSSPYTAAQSTVPTVSGQMSLGQIRLLAQQRADRVNSQFVTLPEWNQYIVQAQYELYDLLIDCNQQYFVAPTAGFVSDGSSYQFALPDGIEEFIAADGSSFVAHAFYKLIGVDMGISNANNAWVTVKQFNFSDRNKFLYPNSASTIYGVFNCQYRLMGNNIEFIPVPSGNQPFRLWYIPRLETPLKDTDLVDGISGWTEYIIVRAAKYALDKEESDTSKLDAQITFLRERIEASSANRDVGQADTISDTRFNGQGWDGGWGRGGF